MREVQIDMLVAAIYHVLFWPDYITPVSTTECDHRMRFSRDRKAMRDANHRKQRLDLVK